MYTTKKLIDVPPQPHQQEAEPIQPQPQQLSATLLTLMHYIRPDMYEFNPANKVWCK